MEDETFTFEEREYLNPNTSRDEQLSFIDAFRETQQRNNQQIQQDTYNLGTPVPSNLGGLVGAESTWRARYQTPQVNAQVANLRQAAQQSALNTALSNLQGVWQNRYNQAQRTMNRAKANYSTRPTTQNPTDTSSLGIDTTTPTPQGDLTLETAPMTVGETVLGNNALDNDVYNSATSGNTQQVNTQGITYKQDGVNYYVTLYRDTLGNITGGKLSTMENETLVPKLDFTKQGITNLLNEVGNSGTKLYDTTGVDITRTWRF